jgi:hypothetical protein
MWEAQPISQAVIHEYGHMMAPNRSSVKSASLPLGVVCAVAPITAVPAIYHVDACAKVRASESTTRSTSH